MLTAKKKNRAAVTSTNPSTEQEERAAKLIGDYISEHNSDILLYSGEIHDSDLEPFNRWILEKTDRDQVLTLFLTTWGGDAHAAYRTARILQRLYEKIQIVIVGPCKSAGTLLSLAGTELVFGDSGELGPLDVQLLRPDDIVRRASGLDTLRAFESIQNRMFSAFEHFMLEIVRNSNGNISTKVACEISSQLTGALIQPIATQIDPYRLGEVERALAIASAYGHRISQKSGNLTADGLKSLLTSYPSHGFVIDEKEATNLFKTVRHCNPQELEITKMLGNYARIPQEPTMFIAFDEFAAEKKGEDDNSKKTNVTQETSARKPGDTDHQREVAQST